MDKTTLSDRNLLYGVIGVLLGIAVTVLVVNNQSYGMMRMMGMGGPANTMMQMHNNNDGRTGMNMSMNDMMSNLDGKTGDDFDKAFITDMIMHHEGAVEMANEAKTQAKHDEIKNLAEAIIVAQTKEINEMSSWYKTWYGVDAPKSNNMMGH